MKIEIFSSDDINRIQYDVNKFLTEKQIDVISLTQSEWALSDPLSRGLTITILYREKDAPKTFGFSPIESGRSSRTAGL